MALVKYNNNSISDITTAGQVATGSLVPIKTLTASSSATLSFVHGTDGVVLDSTYPIYKFEFINIHPATNDVTLQINFSTDGGSNYNVTKTTTFFVARHRENDSATNLDYVTNRDLAQSTSNQVLNYDVGNLSDEDVCGTLTLYNPSSSTFVKHFISRAVGNGQAEDCHDSYAAGYANTASPINAVRFQMSSGNIDAGKIKLYGIKDS